MGSSGEAVWTVGITRNIAGCFGGLQLGEFCHEFDGTVDGWKQKIQLSNWDVFFQKNMLWYYDSWDLQRCTICRHHVGPGENSYQRHPLHPAGSAKAWEVTAKMRGPSDHNMGAMFIWSIVIVIQRMMYTKTVGSYKISRKAISFRHYICISQYIDIDLHINIMYIYNQPLYI